MGKTKIVISSDVGFNGFKTVVGEKSGDDIIELFKTHNNSDIARYKGESIINVVEDALYAEYTTATERRKYVIGNAAKDRYADQVAADDIVSNFYTNSEDAYTDYKRFTTQGMAITHLSVLNEALEKLAGISEKYSDILIEPDKYELTIVVELPEAIAKENNYQSIIRDYITNPASSSQYKVSIEGFDKVKAVPEILQKANVVFTSQVYAAAVCEISSLDYDENQVSSEMLPMFVIDGGGKTVGIATITKTFDLAEKRESNRNYSITKVCMYTSDVIYKEYNYRIEPQLIESKATSKDMYMIADANEAGDYVEINVKDIYEKELKKTIEGLYKYVLDNYRSELFSARSYLFAGGAGELYFNDLSKLINSNFKNATIEKKYILAKGKYGREENGSIFSVAIGGLVLANSVVE